MIIPLFIPVPAGSLFLSVYEPVTDVPVAGWVLHVPAFAEEMNKSRPMISRQARLLAEQGYYVVVPDFSGTGDSSGEFGQADWLTWQQDLSAVIRWIEVQGGQKIVLWALRLGCLMALEVIRGHQQLVGDVIFWQPVLAGKQFLTQFLRLRMAAGLASGKTESTSDLRQLLASGMSVEVAGYDLSPGMVAQLDEVTAVSMPPPHGARLLWMEIVSSASKPMSPASRRVLDVWVGEGANVQSMVQPGDPFWTTQEVALAPGLLLATTKHLASLSLKRVDDARPALATDTEKVTLGSEIPLTFECEGEELIGILHGGSDVASVGVVIVVGGPQYRVGSHRQFVHLARYLADAGIPVLRFDYRGMGDSSGDLAGFEGISRDIGSAVDALQDKLPSVSKVALWGLCDAATAASFYAVTDARIAGLVLLNPWVRSEQGKARAYLKHYYFEHFFSRSFWHKLIQGNVDIKGSVKSLAANIRGASQGTKHAGNTSEKKDGYLKDSSQGQAVGNDLAERLYQALKEYRGPALFISSGNDLTAAEFKESVSASKKFRKLLQAPRFETQDFPESDHTFSRRVWRDQVSQWTLDWVTQLEQRELD